MYCPSCGAHNIDSDVNFCPKCGTQISNPHINEHVIESQSSQLISTQSRMMQPEAIVPQYQAIPTEIGPHSKKAFGFALVSIGLLVASLIMGGGIIIFLITRNIPIIFGMISMDNILMLIPVVIINGLGFIFSIIAKVNASRAKSEMENSMQKVGNVFSVLSIIFNSISLAIVGLIGLAFMFFFYF